MGRERFRAGGSDRNGLLHGQRPRTCARRPLRRPLPRREARTEARIQGRRDPDRVDGESPRLVRSAGAHPRTRAGHQGHHRSQHPGPFARAAVLPRQLGRLHRLQVDATSCPTPWRSTTSRSTRPTDTIGQHIHLVKFDVTSSDGSGNGWNYEDGTFSPEEVRERIFAYNAVALGRGAAPLTLKTHPLFEAPCAAGDTRCEALRMQGTCPPDAHLMDRRRRWRKSIRSAVHSAPCSAGTPTPSLPETDGERS